MWLCVEPLCTLAGREEVADDQRERGKLDSIRLGQSLLDRATVQRKASNVGPVGVAAAIDFVSR